MIENSVIRTPADEGSIMSRYDRNIVTEARPQDALPAERLSRRMLQKLSLLAGGAALLGSTGSSKAAPPIAMPNDPLLAPTSPPTRPWIVSLPIPPVLGATTLKPGPDPGRHQHYSRFPAKKTYLVRARETQHSFHPDLPMSPIWGYNGTFPGTTIDARYGEPIVVRIINELPALATHKGFGLPQLVTHLHNFHTATESDGGPWNWINPGQSKDNHYTMARAGFSDPSRIPAEFRDASGGDVRETLTTLFMHEHRPEYTAANVYKGLVCMVRLFDERDTGNEADRSATAWRLPSGTFDVPLVFADKQFDAAGQLSFDPFNTDGFLGDKITVNGKIQPVMEVKRRKYRFRVLNAGPARFYRFVLRSGGVNQPFTQVTESGNFLEKPRVDLKELELWVAERADIIIDFSRYLPGTELFLANILPMADGRGADRNTTLDPDDVRFQVLKFRVSGETVSDPSRVPTAFRPLPPVNLAEVVQRRTFDLGRSNGMWTINGEIFDPDIDHSPAFLASPRYQIRRDSAEIWTLINSSDSWEHPMHVHFEEGQVLSINGIAVPGGQRARTDMYRLGRGTTMEIFLRFRDFPDPNFAGSPADKGRYVMHCHNTQHEDHSMMVTWNIVP